MASLIRVAQIMGKMVGGGVESVVMNYYRHIDHNKIQFDFIVDSDSTNILREEIESLGGRIYIVPPYSKFLKYRKELKKLFKQNNYKIVHSHINTLSIFPLQIAKSVGIPVRIAHSHSTIINCKKEWKRNLVKKFLMLFSRTFANKYFACSESAAISQFGKKIYTKGDVTIINNAFELDKFRFNNDIRRKIRQEFNIQDETVVIGHVGRFVETKNHEFILKIFNEYHKYNLNSKLVLIGQGPLKNKIVSYTKTMNIEKDVIFLGQIDSVNELYQIFDLLLLPSLYEGLGMVAIEAQISGCPCLCSNTVPNIVNITGRVEFLKLNDSIKKWFDQSNILVGKHFENRKKKFNNGINKYNIKIEVNKLEKLYLKFYK